MTPEQLSEALARGSEQSGVEFKSAGPRSSRLLFAKVLRAIVAMANRRDGGTVILGVSDKDGLLVPTGVESSDRSSWNSDHLADAVAPYVSPHVETFVSHLELGEKTFVVIEVAEFSDTPVLCKKQLSVKGQSHLREGACYVRPRHKNESSELSTYVDSRDLLDLAAEKALRRVMRIVRASGAELKSSEPSDDEKFLVQRSDPQPAVVEKIKSRGFWRVVIRPATFVQEHVPDLASLSEVVPKCAVRVRGWDFPHVDPNQPIGRGLDHVEQGTDWHHHVEWWRLYQSGQFVFFCNLWEDWRDVSSWGPAPPGFSPGQVLFVHSAVYTHMEFVELAARLSLSPAGGSEMVFEVSLEGLQGRELTFSDPSREFFQSRASIIQSFPSSHRMSRDELIADPKEIAARITQQLFARFGWDTSTDVIRGIQAELKGLKV